MKVRYGSPEKQNYVGLKGPNKFSKLSPKFFQKYLKNISNVFHLLN